MKCTLLIMSVFLLVHSCYGGSIGEPDLTGPYHVGHVRFDAVDNERNDRKPQTLVWYPVDEAKSAGPPITYGLPSSSGQFYYESPFIGGAMDAPVSSGGPFPLVVYSHGGCDGSACGYPHQAGMLAEALASYGFVVVAPEHTGTSGNTPRLPTSEMVELRPTDISFIMDLMAERNSTPSDLFFNSVRTESTGLVGYSAGSYTVSANVAGVEALDLPPDPRADALLLLDGWPLLNTPVAVGEPGNPLTLAEVRAVNVPVLSVGQFGISPNGNEFLNASRFVRVDVENSRHWSYFPLSCQIRANVLEADPPQEIIDFVTPDWPGCAPTDIPPGDAQQLLSKHAVSFFMQELDNSPKYAEFQNSATITLELDVTGATAGSSFSFLLTDPHGNRIGIVPDTGELVNDFNETVVHSGVDSSMQTFTFSENSWGRGDYQLEGMVASNASEVSLSLTSDGLESRDVTRITSRRIHYSGATSTGIEIMPILFHLTPGSLGDYDLDNDVDGLDFLKWQRGESLNLNSASDLADWKANYGSRLAPLTAIVPEPSSLILFLWVWIAAFLRQSRRRLGVHNCVDA